LGLAITRRLLELHDAEISVESKIGTGTSFRFSLPTGQYQ
jgi:signal transduction histidine kinase